MLIIQRTLEMFERRNRDRDLSNAKENLASKINKFLISKPEIKPEEFVEDVARVIKDSSFYVVHDGGIYLRYDPKTASQSSNEPTENRLLDCPERRIRAEVVNDALLYLDQILPAPIVDLDLHHMLADGPIKIPNPVEELDTPQPYRNPRNGENALEIVIANPNDLKRLRVLAYTTDSVTDKEGFVEDCNAQYTIDISAFLKLEMLNLHTPRSKRSRFATFPKILGLDKTPKLKSVLCQTSRLKIDDLDKTFKNLTPKQTKRFSFYFHDVDIPITPRKIKAKKALTARGIEFREFKTKKPLNDNPIYDKLITAGFPEAAIESNVDLLAFIDRISRNSVNSKNRSFYIYDVQGRHWLLKVTDNKTQAEVESAANYYLHTTLDFVVPGKFPKPIEASGLYLSLQRAIPENERVERSIEYWVGTLALFHREAENILRQNNVNIKDVQLRPIEGEKERIDRIGFGLTIDYARLADSIEFLRGSPYRTFVHNDPKRDNLVGRYLVDFELCGRGNPGLDLGMLFTQYRIPYDQWDLQLRKYLSINGTKRSFDEELRDLKESTKNGAYYAACREVGSLALRPSPGSQDAASRIIQST